MRSFFSSKQKCAVLIPVINKVDALDIGKELTLLNEQYWDSATATATLTGQFFDKQCWEVMPGFKPKEWLEQEIDEKPTRILIDANTGQFAGLAFTRHVVPADQLTGFHFKV